MHGLVSIVTASFNQLDWLRLAMASVADQEGVTVEHVVQDAGTKNIETLFQPQTKGHTARLFVEKDEGMYDAINRGLKKTNGEILGYLNSDEQYLPGALRAVADYFEAHPGIEVLFGDAILIDSAGQPLSYRRTTLPSLRHLRVAPLNTLTCATFFRRSVIERGHLFPTHLKVAGDQRWVFNLLKSGVKLAVLAKPLGVFTFTGSNLSHSSIADEEKLAWLPAGEKTSHWLAPFTIAWHRIRKLLAGAYRPRKITIQIYVRNNSTERIKISAWLGFRWPVTPRPQ